MPNSITVDDIFSGGSKPAAGITVDDLLGQDFKQQKSAGMEHLPREFAPLAGDFNFTASFRDAMIRDPKTKLAWVAKTLFPNDPEAINRFGLFKGRPVYKDQDGNIKYVSSGLSNFLGQAVGNLPEMVGGTAGAIAGVPGAASGIGNPVTLGALGAAGARGYKDAVAGLIYDEPQTITGNLMDVGKVGLTQLGANALAKGGLMMWNGGRSVNVSPQNLGTAEARRQAIQQSTGVKTDIALASGDRRLLAIRNWLAQQPNATADAIQSADEASSAQFSKAVENVLNKIDTNASLPASVQGQKAITVAQGAIDDVINARNAAVRPYYDAASKVSLSGDVVEQLNKDPVLRDAARRVISDPKFQRDLGITDETVQIPQQFNEREVWRAGKGFVREPVVTNPKSLKVEPNPQTVGFWHQVKGYIDDQIAANAAKPNTVRILTQARNDLNSKLTAASPEYAAANDFFAKQTQSVVDPLKNSIVGVLSRVKDPKAATAALRMFKDENVGAADIFKARQIISSKDPDAWNALVRQFVSREFTKASTTTQAASEANVPGKLYQAIWGNEVMRQRMNAALGKDAADALKGLMDTAEALAKAPIRGSNTQPNMAIEKVVAGRWPSWVRAIGSPRQAAMDAATTNAAERNSALIWEALSDPAKVKQLKIVLKIPDSTVRAAKIGAVLTGTYGGNAGTRAMQPEVQWAAEMQ